MLKAEKKVLKDIEIAIKLAQDSFKRAETDSSERIVRLCKSNVDRELKHALRLLKILEED